MTATFTWSAAFVPAEGLPILCDVEDDAQLLEGEVRRFVDALLSSLAAPHRQRAAQAAEGWEGKEVETPMLKLAAICIASS